MHALATPLVWSQVTVPLHASSLQLSAQVGPHLPAAHPPVHASGAPVAWSQVTVPLQPAAIQVF
ncbi:hypothetical protein D3C83_228780 [compost metagenome]